MLTRPKATGVDVLVVAERNTALGVDHARTPGVAEATGDRSEPVATIAESTDAIGEGTVVVRNAADLAFDTDNPVRSELVVCTDLTAAEERSVTVRAGEANEVRS